MRQLLPLPPLPILIILRRVGALKTAACTKFGPRFGVDDEEAAAGAGATAEPPLRDMLMIPLHFVLFFGCWLADAAAPCLLLTSVYFSAPLTEPLLKASLARIAAISSSCVKVDYYTSIA